MLRVRFEGGGSGEHARLAPACGKRHDRRHLRHPLRQRTRLVERDNADGGKALQRIALLDEKAAARRVADRRHDRRRRRKHEGARAEDDEHGHGAQYIARNEPGKGRRHERRDDDPRRPTVGEAHDLRLARVRLLHEANETRERHILADLLGNHFERAELIQRAALDLVAGILVDGHRLARENRFIDGSVPRQYPAVRRNLLAREDAQAIADRHLVRAHLFRLAVPDAPCHLRCERDEPLDTRAGAPHRILFEESAELHDEGDLTRCKNLADGKGGEKRERYEEIRADIVLTHEREKSAADDRHARKEHSSPRHIKAERRHARKARQQGGRRQHEKNRVLSHTAPIQHLFQRFHNAPPLHIPLSVFFIIRIGV